MTKRFGARLGASALAFAGLGAIVATPSVASGAYAPRIVKGAAAASITVYASGFNNPRGLKFGPDNMLYVAEGGPGGSNSTIGLCQQVPSPVGPYTGSPTGGRISKVSATGARTTVIDTLPSSQTSPDQGNLISGIGDIAFIGNTLYAITAGAGCSHGVVNTDNGVYRITNGSATMIADLSNFQKAHPVAHPNPGDYEPDGTWYSMIAISGLLYAVEPNHGEVDQISPSGNITRVSDISAYQGHIVPTAIATKGGNLYVGNLNTFPIVPGSAKVLRVTRTGVALNDVNGLTTVVGIAFDKVGRMYVLENSVNSGFPTPGMGEVVRIAANGSQQVVASGLALPTAMTFGPDGALYVSNWGFGPPPSLPNGPGQVLRITLAN